MVSYMGICLLRYCLPCAPPTHHPAKVGLPVASRATMLGLRNWMAHAAKNANGVCDHPYAGLRAFQYKYKHIGVIMHLRFRCCRFAAFPHKDNYNERCHAMLRLMTLCKFCKTCRVSVSMH